MRQLAAGIAAAYDNRGIAYRRADDHKKANADFVPARRLKAGQQEGRIVPSPILRPPNALRQATSK